MRISGFTTTRPEMASTRTAEDFMKFLGSKPARLGMVASLYDQYSTSALTEALMNVYTQEKNPKNSFQKLNTFMVEWDIKVERVKKVMIMSAEGDGKGGSDILIHVPENYYQKYDTFIVEETRQQFMVMNRPQRLRDNDFLLVCKILDDNYDVQVVGGAEALAGKLTRFVTNYMPEMHEEGYTKYQSNLEKHRTYISSHRCDIDASAQYLAMEDVFIQIGKGDKDDPVYKMDGMQKVLLDNFMQVRNNKLLYGKSNVDKYGKPTIYEPETGRPIVTGDGIIAQIERFANKFVFSRLNTKLFNKALQAMVSKCDKATGNKFAFICNEAMWLEIQETLSAWIRDWKTTGTFLFSKASNGYVDLGATYQSYEFAGNTVTFMIDRTLNIEFPNRKFGMFLDLTPDKSSGKAAINMFTFKNGEMIHNYITGVGGRSGMSSGEVSSRVAASKEVMFGYAGVGVMNPYKSVILISDENTSNLF